MTLDAPLDRIGIVMLSAVGDAVHVLPVIAALKRHRPHCRISWVLQPGPAALVRGHPLVDDIVLFDRRLGRRAFLAARRELVARPFDVVLDLQTYFKAGVLTGMTRAPVKLGYDRARAKDLNWLFTTHRIPPRPTAHMQEEFLEFLDVLGVPREPIEWGLGPREDERPWQREFISQFDHPVVSLVIGSSKPEKDWLPERWGELSDALRADFGLQPVLVGGRSPRERTTERIVMERTRQAPHSALDSGLRRLVSILDASALVVSLDTGPLHVSVALDRPVVSLVGYTDPRRTGPFRKYQELVVDAFHEPGEQGPISRGTRTGRMARISVRDVLERVERWRGGHASAAASRTPRKS